ncbi:MAG TPA: hypothetical protein VGG12_00200 [Methylovirgula sp.]
MRLVLLLVGFFAAGAALAADKPIRFWNLTAQTVTSLQLAKAGTTDFGPDLCKTDKDGNVDTDERLALPDITPGMYDAKLGYADGRHCVAKNLTLQASKVFSIEDKDLTDCAK